MVAYFKRECFFFSLVGSSVGLLAAIALYPGTISTQPGYIRMYYIAMLVIVGFVFGRMYAAVWANKRLKSINGILYQQGRPQEFIDAFGPLVSRTKPDSAEAMAGKIKLAFANEALGKFQEALDSLEDLDPNLLKLHALPVAANLRNQQLRLALLLEDKERASTYMAELRSLEETARGRATTIASQLRQCIRLAECWMAVLEAKDSDMEYLSEEIRLATNDIHKSEMQLLLARAQHNRGDNETAFETLLDAKVTGQGFWTGKKAGTLIQQLS